jgi:hypothetical protein
MTKKSFHVMLCVLAVVALTSAVSAQSYVKTRRASAAAICGNPQVTCKTSVTFQPYDLPFRVPANAVILDTELFYVVILKSVPSNNDSCDVFISESERLAAQVLFPDRKVFSSRCIDPENLFYLDETVKTRIKNISETHRIMALYAGTTLADAKRVLETVNATGKFPGANIRRIRTGFNGT